MLGREKKGEGCALNEEEEEKKKQGTEPIGAQLWTIRIWGPGSRPGAAATRHCSLAFPNLPPSVPGGLPPP